MNENGNAKWDICVVVVVEGCGVDVDLVVDFEVEDGEDEEEHNRNQPLLLLDWMLIYYNEQELHSRINGILNFMISFHSE